MSGIEITAAVRKSVDRWLIDTPSDAMTEEEICRFVESHRIQARNAALEEAAVRADEIAEIADRAKNIGMQAGLMVAASEIRKLALPLGHNGGPTLSTQDTPDMRTTNKGDE